MDKVTPEKRSDVMRQVRSRDTKPELIVRRLLHAMGYRYRLHRKDLPGKPDLVLPRLRVCVFVHGCFWHRHLGCRLAATPKSNEEYWMRKFEGNVKRDERSQASLTELGWRVVTIWECETRNLNSLRALLERRLEPPGD